MADWEDLESKQKVYKKIIEKGPEDSEEDKQCPADDQICQVTYIGRLLDGTQFDEN